MFAGELRKQKALFASADALALVGAFVAALQLHDPYKAIQQSLLGANPALLAMGMGIVVLMWMLVFRANDLYRMRNGGAKELIAIVYACTIATLLTLLAGFFFHVQVMSRITVTLAYLLSVPFVVSARTLLRIAIHRIYSNPKIAIPLVIVGFNSVGQYLCDQILDELGPYDPIGFVDDNADQRQQYRGLPLLASIDRLGELATSYRPLEVAIALPEAPREQLERIVEMCDEARIHWWIVPWILRSLSAGMKVEMVGVVPLVARPASNIEGFNFMIKRAFDTVVGTFLLILAAPVLAIAALLIMLDDGRPVFFRQTRIGAHSTPFEMMKLRTMRVRARDDLHREYVQKWIGSNGSGKAEELESDAIFKMTDDPRITRAGKLLRRLSIDELPQLINVVRGQMSLIGPRPALPYELEMYQNWHRRRLEGPPGITGLWQVSGRNRLSFDEMVRLDVQYLEDWSLLGDLKILARTLPVLLRGSGV